MPSTSLGATSLLDVQANLAVNSTVEAKSSRRGPTVRGSLQPVLSTSLGATSLLDVQANLAVNSTVEAIYAAANAARPKNTQVACNPRIEEFKAWCHVQGFGSETRCVAFSPVLPIMACSIRALLAILSPRRSRR